MGKLRRGRVAPQGDGQRNGAPHLSPGQPHPLRERGRCGGRDSSPALGPRPRGRSQLRGAGGRWAGGAVAWQARGSGRVAAAGGRRVPGARRREGPTRGRVGVRRAGGPFSGSRLCPPRGRREYGAPADPELRTGQRFLREQRRAWASPRLAGLGAPGGARACLYSSTSLWVGVGAGGGPPPSPWGGGHRAGPGVPGMGVRAFVSSLCCWWVPGWRGWLCVQMEPQAAAGVTEAGAGAGRRSSSGPWRRGTLGGGCSFAKSRMVVVCASGHGAVVAGVPAGLDLWVSG